MKLYTKFYGSKSSYKMGQSEVEGSGSEIMKETG